jgi:hypothetical protein
VLWPDRNFEKVVTPIEFDGPWRISGATHDIFDPHAHSRRVRRQLTLEPGFAILRDAFRSRKCTPEQSKSC